MSDLLLSSVCLFHQFLDLCVQEAGVRKEGRCGLSGQVSLDLLRSGWIRFTSTLSSLSVYSSLFLGYWKLE